MKILVFGASGGTGLELVKQGLGAGHEVTAFVRNPDSMQGIQHESLSVVAGDVLDAADVGKAVAGHGAVLFAVGAGREPSNVREKGALNVIGAMQAAGVKRLVCLSSMGVGDSQANLPWFTKRVIVGIYLRHAFADHERQEAAVKESGLDWTLVRPPHLKDGPRTGVYQHGFPVNYRDIKGWISRSDLAEFMLKQISDDRYVKALPGLSY
jgi:putative NADH-flavin reductase